MPHNFDVTCIGNAKVDSFITLQETSDHIHLSKDSNELCIKLGEKIVVDSSDVLLGGDAANVSVGVSRLGLSSSIVAEIGNDVFAPKIVNVLKKEKVDTSNILQTEGQKSSFSTIINYQKERTIFSEHVRRSHDFDLKNITSKCIYLTSLGEEWKNTYSKTAQLVKDLGCFLAFNPGTMQIKSGKDSIENILSITDLLIVNKEEGETLLNFSHGEKEIKNLIGDLQKIGPKIVVITDGKNGSTAIDSRGNIFRKQATEDNVVEKTGAGDAYSSGFLSALLYGKSILEAMEWGTKNAASVIGMLGAQAGLLHKTDLIQAL